MYLAMPYFVFIGAMVSCLIHFETASHVWKPGFSISLSHLVYDDEDGPCLANLHEEPSDVIVFYMIIRVLFNLHYVDLFDSIVLRMSFSEPTCFVKALNSGCASMGPCTHKRTLSLIVHDI